MKSLKNWESAHVLSTLKGLENASSTIRIWEITHAQKIKKVIWNYVLLEKKRGKKNKPS